ncbi:MAG: DNA repair protein RadC [bacterium]|nr:DNA repair protein RadC [bacterium]
MPSTNSQPSLLPFPASRRVAPPRNLPIEDQPRQRILRTGAAALSDAELLGLLLRGGPSLEATELAQHLLVDVGGLGGLLRTHGSELERPGLGPARRAAILASVELGRRLARARMPRRDLLDSPDVVARYLMLRYGNTDQEVMGALYLDVRNRLIGEGDVYRGTLSRAAVEPRVILKQGLLSSANGFILFHTHPSGDPTPSAEDLAFTRRLAEAGDLLGVRLIDHLVLGGAGRWVSLGRRGAW